MYEIKIINAPSAEPAVLHAFSDYGLMHILGRRGVSPETVMTNTHPITGAYWGCLPYGNGGSITWYGDSYLYPTPPEIRGALRSLVSETEPIKVSRYQQYDHGADLTIRLPASLPTIGELLSGEQTRIDRGLTRMYGAFFRLMGYRVGPRWVTVRLRVPSLRSHEYIEARPQLCPDQYRAGQCERCGVVEPVTAV